MIRTAFFVLLCCASLPITGCEDDSIWLFEQYKKACNVVEAEVCCPPCQCVYENKFVYWGPFGVNGIPEFESGECVDEGEYTGSVEEDIAACEDAISNGNLCVPYVFSGMSMCGIASTCDFAAAYGRCECPGHPGGACYSDGTCEADLVCNQSSICELPY